MPEAAADPRRDDDKPLEISGPAAELKIVVIGTSAGGFEVLKGLVGNLPADLAACILIVKHVAPQTSVRHCAHVLDQLGSWQVREAKAGDPLTAALNRPAQLRSDITERRKLRLAVGPLLAARVGFSRHRSGCRPSHARI